MAFSQKGATYEGRDALANPPLSLADFQKHVLHAADDLASQLQAVRAQGNFGQKGSPTPPHPPTAIAVSAAAGFATVNLTHSGAPPGSQYVIEYSPSPSFQNPIPVDNGSSLIMHRYLKGLKLYFRAASKFAASSASAWTYYGSASTPTPVTF